MNKPYNFEITDENFYAFNMFYNLSEIIVKSFKCYINELKRREENGETYSLPFDFQSLEELNEEVEKIIEGFEILADDYHDLSWTKEGEEKINYALKSFSKYFPTFWI